MQRADNTILNNLFWALNGLAKNDVVPTARLHNFKLQFVANCDELCNDNFYVASSVTFRPLVNAGDWYPVETKHVEYKVKISNTFLKTVSAYANYEGGHIYFGIDDDGNPIGIDDIESNKIAIENKINNSVTPVPEFELSVDEKQRIIELEVFEGNATPYLCNNKAYRRSDTSTVEVDQVELRRLILKGNNQSYDSLPSSSTDLAFTTLERKLIDELHIHSINNDILNTLGLYSPPAGYNVAAELLADTNSYPGLDIVRFGDSINEIADRERLDRISIIKQLDSAMGLFEKYYSVETISGSTRTKKFLIPETAFREAMANALVHRAWDINSAVRISMHDNHIQIVSPGGLPFGMSTIEYLNGRLSVARNPIIANVFYRLKYIEMFATGIRRIKELYQEYVIQPEFQIEENSISVILPIIEEDLNILSPQEQQVLSALSRHTSKSRADIEKTTGFSKDTLIRVLNSLTSKNVIEHLGEGRARKYARK